MKKRALLGFCTDRDFVCLLVRPLQLAEATSKQSAKLDVAWSQAADAKDAVKVRIFLFQVRFDTSA